MLSSAVQEESLNCWYLFFNRQSTFQSQLNDHEKKYYNPMPGMIQEYFLVKMLLSCGYWLESPLQSHSRRSHNFY